MTVKYEEIIVPLGQRYFLGPQINSPFHARVYYAYDDEKFLIVTNIMLSIEAMRFLNGSEALYKYFVDAARDHYIKHYSANDDLKGLF